MSYYTLEGSKAYWQLPREKLEVLYNGVQLSQFFPDKALQQQQRTKLGLFKHEKVILYVGRVNEQKGTTS